MDTSLAQELTCSLKLETITAQIIPLTPRVLFPTHYKTVVKESSYLHSINVKVRGLVEQEHDRGVGK